MRLLDFWRVPTVVDVDGRHGDTPYRASCPEGDWQSDRWVATARTAREQQTRHYAKEHYRFSDSWFGGASDDRDPPGEGKGWFW